MLLVKTKLKQKTKHPTTRKIKTATQEHKKAKAILSPTGKNLTAKLEHNSDGMLDNQVAESTATSD